MLADPPLYKRRGSAHHRNSLSIVGHRQQPVSTTAVEHHSLSQSFRTQPLLLAFAFAVSFHTVAFGSACPYILFPHKAPSSSAHLSQSSGTQLPVAALAFSQPFGTRLSPHAVAFANVHLFQSFAHGARPFRSLSHTVAFNNNRISQSSRTRLLVAAFVAHGCFCRRSPLSTTIRQDTTYPDHPHCQYAVLFGNWKATVPTYLALTCNHLANWMLYPEDGNEEQTCFSIS